MARRYPLATLLLTAALLPAAVQCDCPQTVGFIRISGQDCVDPSFAHPQSGITTVQACALSCSALPGCLAFAFLRPLCRRFVFDRHSRRVRRAGCSDTGSDIFVRGLAGMPAGRLCATAFGHDYRGTKYILNYTKSKWQDAKTRCDSLGGLAKLAELADKPEMDNIATIDPGTPWGAPVWLAGVQPPGSVEPDQGWVWAGSELPVSMSTALWNPDDPDVDVAQNRICLMDTTKLLNDRAGDQLYNFLCQCVSPFD